MNKDIDCGAVRCGLELPKVLVFTAVSGQVSCFYNYQTLLLLVLISVVLLDCILRVLGFLWLPTKVGVKFLL